MSKQWGYNVTGVWLKIWNAIHEIDTNGNRRWRYILLKGSSRSSKTWSAIDVYDHYARLYKNKRLTVYRDTKTDCKKTVLADALKRFKETNRFMVKQTFNITESIFTYTKTGSTFEIHGADEVGAHGFSQSVSWMNEPYLVSRTIFDQVDQRTEDFIIIDLNPRAKHWSEDIEKDSRCIVIHSTFKDNPFCPPEQRLKILSYQPLSMCDVVLSGLMTEQQAREYDIVSNTALLSPVQIEELSRCKENEYKNSASEYNWSVYGLGVKAEKPNRIFHWKPISIDEYNAIDVTRYYGCDFGSVDPWAIGEAKYLDGCLYLKELNYDSENQVRDKMTPGERSLVESNDEGIVSWMFGRLGIPQDAIIVCDSNRPLKIKALREAGWDYAVAAVKGAGSIIDGIDLLNNLKVFYTADSVNIESEQENYSRQIDRYGVVLDEPEDFNNHHMDQVRYVSTLLQSMGVISKV